MGHGRKPILRIDDAPPPAGEESATEPHSDADHGGISLEALSVAFAEAMQLGQHVVAESRSPIATSIEPRSELSLPGHVSISTIVEAILFVGSPSGPNVPISEILRILPGTTVEEIRSIARELNEIYRTEGMPFEIEEDADMLQLRLATDMEHARDAFSNAPKTVPLSQQALDCLALIAYQPGIEKEALEQQWGQPAGATLSFLIRKGLVRCDDEGEQDETIPKAPRRYFTTTRFLEILGLASLDDLPQGEEL